MAKGTKSGRTRGGLIAAEGIPDMEPGKWLADPAARGAGRLQVRKLAAGEVVFYYRYAAPDGERVRLPLGAGLSLADARAKAAELSRRYQSGERDLRAILDAEQREADRLRRDIEAVDAAEQAKQRATLGALVSAYIEQLRRDGKASARAVELAATRHLKDAWPVLWTTPADDVTSDDLLAVVARLTDADKLREASKLRSYLRASYAAGIRARQDARSIASLRDLRITTNPARDLVTIEGSTNARDRALSIAELRAYWQRIVALPDPEGAMLRFHLLTGGQRAEQLARLTMRDVDRDSGTIRLLDSKGRRRKPRVHVVPLIPAAAAALKAMHGGLHGEHAFTLTGGFTSATYAIMQHRVRAVVDGMDAAGELEHGPFTVGDLRRTVETRLAAEGVSLDVRAQLQSHGLGGVQARHYDRHGYIDEKRAALETLHRLVTGTPAKVTTITRVRSRKASGEGR